MEVELEFRSLGEYHVALDTGRLRRGDVVFVSATLYAWLSEHERSWLWRSALEARVRLVTNVDMSAAIVVRSGSPRPRGPFYRDARDADAVMLFEHVADFESAVGSGVLAYGDCVQVVAEELRSLPAPTCMRLEREVVAAGACLCEGDPPAAVAVYRGAGCPPGRD